MRLLKALPLLVVPWLVYNGLVLATADPRPVLGRALVEPTLLSGAVWRLTVGDAFVAAGLLLLYAEIFKATATGVGAVVNHTLSTLVFVAYLVELLGVRGAATSPFFLLTLMAFVDVVAGFTVSIVSARRDIGLAGGGPA